MLAYTINNVGEISDGTKECKEYLDEYSAGTNSFEELIVLLNDKTSLELYDVYNSLNEAPNSYGSVRYRTSGNKCFLMRSGTKEPCNNEQWTELYDTDSIPGANNAFDYIVVSQGTACYNTYCH